MRNKIAIAAIILLTALATPSGLAFRSVSAAPDLTMTSASASTNASGRISTNTTWSLVNSPYIVVDDILVETNVFLTIEPGVLVRFIGGTNIIIDGALIAQGNSTHPITFTSSSSTPKPGDWGTIKFRDTSIDKACAIDWAIIEYATDGITLYNSSPNIDNSIFRFNVDGLYSEYNGVARISDSAFLNNSYGIRGSFAYSYYPYTGGSVILNSHVSNNTYGVSLGSGYMMIQESDISRNTYGIRSSGTTLRILGSDVSYNTYGVVGSSVFISKSVISNNNGCGISPEWYSYNPSEKYYYDGSFWISYSTITGNKENGIVSKGYNINYIHFSNVYGNTPYDVSNLASYDRNADVNATDNWWGTINTTEIDEHVYDYHDDYNLRQVLYQPVLDSPVTLPPVTHDIAIVNVTASPTTVEKWQSVYINVYVLNQGDFDENVTVIASYDSVQIGKWTPYGLLGAGANALATFWWYPSNVLPGNYTISAEVSAVPGETDTDDNLYVDGNVTVTGPLPSHDIAVTYVYVSPTSVRPGEPVTIAATVQNQGDFTETIMGTAYYGAIIIETVMVNDLPSGGSTTLIFLWNTTGVASGEYQIKIEASPVPGEVDTSDNTYLSSWWVTVTGPRPPRADFYYSPDRPTIGDSVYFNAYSSYDPDGYIVSYAWDFGDGTSGTVTSPYWTHVYSNYGSFTVTLTVTDNTNQTGSIARAIRVNTPPVAAFRWTPEEIRANETVTFESLSYDLDGWIVDYQWNFGDGTTATGAVAQHVYTQIGMYWVSLYVTDNDGRGLSYGTQITVISKLTMSTTPDNGIVGTPVTITGANATPNDLVKLYWGSYVFDYYNWRVNYTLIGASSTNSEGEFSFDFMIPPSILGVHFVRVADVSTGNYNEQTFIVQPSMRITPISGPVGTKVTVNGTGFPLSYYMPGFAYLMFDDQFFAFAIPDENGNMRASINAPTASLGSHVIKAVMMTSYPYPGAPQSYTLENVFTLVDVTPLDIDADVGTIYFKGETVELYVQITLKGARVNATSMSVSLLKPDRTTVALTPQQIATGLYRISYTIVGKTSMIGTYTIIIEANHAAEAVAAQGNTIGTFIVKPTWERETPRMAAFSITSIGLVSAMILLWRKEKKKFL